LALVFFAIAALALVYFSLRGVSALRQGYSWHEMDWDKSGHTSLIEFLEASDVGKREVTENGCTCIEYFSYKDGLPIKVVCKH
jgi:hypothetical protein